MAAESKEDDWGTKGNLLVPLPPTERGRNARLSVSSDGRYVLYGSGVHVIVREVANPARAMVYGEHTKPVTAAAMSHNGNYVASGDSHGQIRVWAFNHVEHILKLEMPAFPGPVECIAWDSENKRIAAGGAGGSYAKVFNWDTGSALAEIVPHEKAVLSVAFKPTRPYRVALGSEDNAVTFYSGPPFKNPSTIRDHSSFCNGVAFSPDGSKLITCGSDKKIYIYDGASGEKIGKMKVADKHDGSVYGIAFSPDGSRLASAGGDKNLKTWDVEGKKAEASRPMGTEVNDQQVAVVWGRETGIISLSLRGDINIFGTADITSDPVVVTGGQTGISALAWDAAAGRLVSGWKDGSAVTAAELSEGSGEFDQRRITSGDGKELRHSGAVSAIAAREGVVASGGPDNVINVGDSVSGVFKSAIAVGHRPRGIALTARPNVVITATAGHVRVYEGDALKSEEKADWEPTCLAASDDGKRIAVGGADNKVHFYTLDDSLALADKGTGDNHNGALTAVAFASDGLTLATGDKARDVRVYTVTEDISSIDCLIRSMWTNHSSMITCVAWSPDGTKIVSGATDNMLCVWDPATKKLAQKIERAHFTTITSVAWESNDIIWSADGHGVARRRTLSL